MPRWGTNPQHKREPEVFNTVVEGLQKLYKDQILPLEKDFRYQYFYSPLLTDGDFAAKPMMMLIGQYSTGKTTFIKHLLERDYPGLRIGPEPTTDRFVAIMDGEEDQTIPGNAAVVDVNKAFSQLTNFGNAFLARFECSILPSAALKGVTLIDTPGVLSGNKQTSRGYDFEGVIRWFAERVDIILLMFDAHKLDISDEFRRCIQALRGNDTKIRILLNKSDMVSNQQLMRVYGALMWSLGKVIPTPEVARVYIGSFWDQPLQNDENRKLFEAEANDLYTDIALLPRNAAIRKLNDFIKRCRLVRVHVHLLNYMKKQLPTFGKEGKKKQMIATLAELYKVVAAENQLPVGDFPPVAMMQEKLASFDFSKIPKFDARRLADLDGMLSRDIPQLMKLVPAEEKRSESELPMSVQNAANPSPFQNLKSKGHKVGQWEVDKWLGQPVDVSQYEADFRDLDTENKGKISGGQAKGDLTKSKLPSNVLHKIWNLADVSKDGYLDLEEYAICRHLIHFKLEGGELPSDLPEALKPPSKARAFA